MIALLAACAAPEPSAQAVPLDPAGWRVLARSDDPLADHRPSDDACPDAARRVEGEVLEVDSGGCHWLAVARPSPFADGRLWGEVWHTGLDAPEPAEAHFAVVVDGSVAWETVRPIPDEAWFAEIDVELVAAGELVLHLHNHGDNQWRLGPFEVVPGEP